MKPSELFEALHALITERVPLHIWGACGVGKSQIVAQVASDLDWQFLDIRAVQLDPVDLRGLPRISADQAEWVPPKFLPTSGRGILFLDELTAAPQMTQAGCYQLVLDRKLGEYHLPEGWVVVAAGNPASERGVHFSMPRFASGVRVVSAIRYFGVTTFANFLPVRASRTNISWAQWPAILCSSSH